MARDDAEEALVVEDFEYSAAQQRYQVEAQSQRGNNDAMREELFYKDATPKAEHYISFVVRLPPNRRPRKGAAHALADAPLDLELLYAPSAPGEDYVTVPDQGHLKRCEPARRDGDPKGPSERPRLGLVLRYRIELGSYRQGDRRFVVRATIAKAARGGDASPPRPGKFLPAHTPPVYVASKVKRPRAALRDDDGDEDDDRASSSPPPPSKRAHLNGRGAPLLPAVGSSEVLERLARLEATVETCVLPALQRIEARLGTAVPEMDGLDPEEADVLQHLVANAPGDGADLFAPFYPSDGTPWADMMSTMGSGLDGVPHSLANTQEDS